MINLEKIEGKRLGRARLALAFGAALIALMGAQAAQAYEAFVNVPAPILTGPSPDYPPVVYLHGGEPVEVYGCLDGYSWCDIQFREFRGWFDASLLSYPYEGQRVPLYDYGYDIGLPIIGFSIDEYWGRFYRDRPFFAERDRFARIPPPPPREYHDHHEGGPGFYRPEHGPDGFDRDHDRGPPPRGPEFDRSQEQGRPEFDRGQPRDQQPQRTQEQQHAAPPQQRPQPVQQAQPQQQRPQPQQRTQPQAPQQAHPQAAPAPQAHPEGHPAEEHGEGPHNQDNR